MGSDNHVFSFVVEGKNYEAYRECLRDIMNLLDGNQDVPSSMIAQLMSYLNSIEQMEFNEFRKKRAANLKKANEETPVHVEKAIEYFSKNDFNNEYDFSGNSLHTYGMFPEGTPIDTVEFIEENISYSLRDLLQYCIWNYLLLGSENDKKQAILEFHGLVCGYAATTFNPKHQEELSDYKSKAITGYLVHMVAGFKLIDKSKKITNARLYAAVLRVIPSGKDKKKKD